jgi:hypothetical protein
MRPDEEALRARVQIEMTWSTSSRDVVRHVLRLLEQLDHAGAAVELDHACVALSSSVPSWANASSSRNAARSSRSEPAIFFIALIWALPPTRDTEMPTLTAGRTPAKNRSGSR